MFSPPRPGFSTAAVVLAVALASQACASKIQRTPGPLSAEQSAQLWIEPGPEPRNLINGVGHDGPRPVVDARYEVEEVDPSGFSITYEVEDEQGREWNVKIGPEARTEVVASRIVWAVGYHQVPSYFVERWVAVTGGKAQTLGGARFRPKDDNLDSEGTWAWRSNPFVGTRAYNGLLVLMMILNGTDLKDDNNAIYEVEDGRREGARRWYVVKDLGASLGETGRMDPRRGYLEGFEREPYIERVEPPYVRFAFRGRHQDLLERITVADVKWMSERVMRITERQWRDAFAAGGYDAETTRRYVKRIKEKASQGLALP